MFLNTIVAQLCALLIILIISFYFFFHQCLFCKSEKIFSILILTNILSVILDIEICLFPLNYLNNTLTQIFCKAYIISLIMVAFAGVYYSECFNKVITFVFSTSIIAAILLPINITMFNNNIILSGSSLNVVFFILLMSLMYIIGNSSANNRRKKHSLISWIIIWLCGLFIQTFYPQLHTISFANAIGVLIVFLEIENPEFKTDKETKLPIISELFPYVSESPIPLNIIDITLNGNLSDNDAKKLLDEIIHQVKSLKCGQLFKETGYELVLALREDINVTEYINTLNSCIEEYMVPSYIIINTVDIDNPKKIMPLFFRYKASVKFDRRKINYITKSDYEKFKHIDKIKELIINAIKNDEIELYIQPIYSIKENLFDTGEVLCRIRHNDTLIFPGTFMPVAEKTGLITSLETEIFRKACEFMHTYNLQRYGVSHLHINLSVRQAERDDLYALYTEIMNKYNISPDMINLEITETLSFKSRDKVLKNMYLFIQDGIKFSLDDFGNGSCNLNYVVDMPIDIIKFDKDMTQSYFTNNRAKSVMISAISMAQNMNIKIVTEGIETREQLECMKRLEIDYIQGYYFSKPISCSNFISFVRKNNVTK